MTLKKARPESKRQKRLTIKQARESIEMEDRLNSWQQRPESLTIILICAVGFLLAFAFGRYTNEVREVSAPIETTETIQQKVRPVIRQEIEKSRDTTPAWMPKVERPLRERMLVWKDANRGGNWINRLDAYLAGSPMAGQGRTIYLAAIDRNVDPRRIVAIATVESSKGRHLAGRFNAWGRKSLSGGWMSWSSWDVAIADQAAYLSRWGEKIWTSYCVPPEPWGSKVRGEIAKV